MKTNENVSLVTLSGGVQQYFQYTYQDEPNPLSQFNNQIHMIPAPLLVTSFQTAQSILKEPEIDRIIRMAELANIAVVGIGSPSANATFTNFGYITSQDLEILRMQGAVGDILGHFFDKNGDELAVPHHNRTWVGPRQHIEK